MKIGGAPHCGADTRVCGVETHLDAFVSPTNPHFSTLSPNDAKHLKQCLRSRLQPDARKPVDRKPFLPV
jgi:hypothetical protein